MGKIIKLVVICVVAYGGYYAYDSYKTVKEGINFAGLTVPLLNDLSSNWSIVSLKKHIEPVGFEGNEALYIKMLKKVSYLGKFKVCNDLNVGKPTTLDIEGAKAIAGLCQFENGNAEIMQIFIKEEENFKTYSFIIKPA